MQRAYAYHVYIHRNHKVSDNHVTSCNMLLSASSGRDVRSKPVSHRKLVSSYVTRIPRGLLLKLRQSGLDFCWITRRGTNYDNRSRGGTWAFDINVSRLGIISRPDTRHTVHGMLVRAIYATAFPRFPADLCSLITCRSQAGRMAGPSYVQHSRCRGNILV